MNKEHQDILDEVYRKYADSHWTPPSNPKGKLLSDQLFSVVPMEHSKESFINKIKTDDEFSKRWGLKIGRQKMSKRKEKRERVKQRWDALQTEIDNLFNSIMYESFTEWKDIIEIEIIQIIKKYNVMAWYGRELKVITSIHPVDNEYTFDVRTIKGNWRVMKIIR